MSPLPLSPRASRLSRWCQWSGASVLLLMAVALVVGVTAMHTTSQAGAQPVAATAMQMESGPSAAETAAAGGVEQSALMQGSAMQGNFAECGDCGAPAQHSMLIMGCILALLTVVLVVRHLATRGHLRSLHVSAARVAAPLVAVLRQPPRPSLVMLSISRT